MDWDEKLVELAFQKVGRRPDKSNTKEWNRMMRMAENMKQNLTENDEIIDDDIEGGNIIEDEDRGYQIGFEIDGIKFSGEDLEKLLGGFQGLSLRYQIQDASDPILKEDEYLVPVYITKTSLIGELKTAINIYSDRGFISYKDTFKFSEVFYNIIDKLEVLAHSEKRDKALEAGRDMVRIMKSIETDDDYFPLYNIQLICKIVDPFGIDEELKRICGDLYF
jgi:hypothetical protein